MPAEPVIADAIGKLLRYSWGHSRTDPECHVIRTYTERYNYLSSCILRKFGFSECFSIALGITAATGHRQDANLTRNSGTSDKEDRAVGKPTMALYEAD